MQTFLPYKSFTKSANVLDNKRLGKQRVEGLQILNVLLDYENAKGWKNHPAVLMWQGYEMVLVDYIRAMINEWVLVRGFKDSIEKKLELHPTVTTPLPPWLGGYKFHQSHKSNLLRKDPVHYSQFNWNVPDNLEYIWPVQKQ